MLDALGRGDQRCVLGGGIAFHAHQLLALGDEALHALADLGRARDTDLAECLLDALQMIACLLEVVLEGLTKLIVVRRLRHLRQRRGQLRLGAVQILELLLQDVLERIEPHVRSPFRFVFLIGVPRPANCKPTLGSKVKAWPRRR